MATMIRDGFQSPQIWVTKRETKILEVLNRLVPAHMEYAENIFGMEKYQEGNQIKKDYSLLPLILQEGKGEGKKSVRYNFTPNDFVLLRRECEPSVNYQRTYFREMRKMNKREDGMLMRTIQIRFDYFRKNRDGSFVTDKNGEKQISNYPWYIGITEQLGESDKNRKKIVHEQERKMNYILISSEEYQSMLDSVCRFIDIFSIAFGVPLLRKKYQESEERKAIYFAGQKGWK